MNQAYAWWQTGVVYQVYPRSFKDTNGDGIGDLLGVVEKLDYLGGTLGVDAIWLSPFYPSPMADFGYDVSDYTGVDPRFGTLDDFDRLVAEAHARGLKLIIDFVPNHSSDQHPWFVASRSSRDDPKRDWYVWRDPKPDGSPPNNWLSVFGGPAWEWDEATGQYYLHSFLKEQPDFNWRNPEVEQALFDVVRFWLDRGVDGFRIDVAHAIMKDPALRDNPPNPDPVGSYHKDLREYGRQLHVHDKGHEDVHGVYRRLRKLVDGYDAGRPRVTIGEMHLYDWSVWVRYYGADLDGLHMPFNFALLKADWNARAIRASVDGLEAHLPEGAWPNYVLGNHDEARLATRYGEAGARLAAVLLLTLRGTPTLYYGDEIGMREVMIPPERQQDPWGRRVPGLGRDGCRMPMAWDDGPMAGFTTAERAWLPLHEDHEARNVASQLADPRSLLTLYRRMLALRRSSPALQGGAYRPLDDVPADCFVFLRETPGETRLVALNFSGEAQRVEGIGPAELLLSTHLDWQAGARVHGPLTLRAHEGAVLAL
jgi:alpha-glucosidase